MNKQVIRMDSYRSEERQEKKQERRKETTKGQGKQEIKKLQRVVL
jgi:hypothetical protein